MERGRALWLTCVIGVCVSLSAAAEAQPGDPEAPPPSQDVVTDSDVPYYRLAVSTDPAVAAIYGTYTLQVEVALAPHHAVWVMPIFSTWKSDILALGFGYHFWLSGEGTQGFFVGPHVAIGSSLEGDRAFGAAGGVEIGYQVVWGGIVLGIAVGFNQLWTPTSSEYSGDVLPRIHAALGYAWM